MYDFRVRTVKLSVLLPDDVKLDELLEKQKGRVP